MAGWSHEDRADIRIGEEFRPLGANHGIIRKHRVVLQVKIRLQPPAVRDRLSLGRQVALTGKAMAGNGDGWEVALLGCVARLVSALEVLAQDVHLPLPPPILHALKECLQRDRLVRFVGEGVGEN